MTGLDPKRSPALAVLADRVRELEAELEKFKPSVTSGTMRARVYPALRRCIEDGVAMAWNCRVYKYTPTPTDAQVIDTIAECVIDAVCEAFDFPEDDEGLT